MLANTIRQLNCATKRSAPFLSCVRHKAAYEGEGKTTVRVINQDQELGLMIDAYATYGFKLNNGLTVLGPMAIFSRTVLSWQVRSASDITKDTIKFFKLLEPQIDLVIMGLESNDRKTVTSVLQTAREVGLNIEILPTEHACSTFNFLNAEGRSVAAALIPPLSIDLNEDDMLESQIHYSNIYKRGFRDDQ